MPVISPIFNKLDKSSKKVSLTNGVHYKIKVVGTAIDPAYTKGSLKHSLKSVYL